MPDSLGPSDFFEGRIFARGLDVPLGSTTEKVSVGATPESQISWLDLVGLAWVGIVAYKLGPPHIGPSYGLSLEVGGSTLDLEALIEFIAKNQNTTGAELDLYASQDGTIVEVTAFADAQTRKIIDKAAKSDFIATLAEQGLKVIRGTIDTTTPTILRGSGFTVVKNNVGDITITFTNAFGAIPTMLATALAAVGNARVVTVNTVSTTASRMVRYVPSTLAADNGEIHFEAKGSI